jgi:hypothetical protein
MLQFRFVALTLALALGLFVGMVVLLEVGRRFGLRQTEEHGSDARSGVGVVDTVVYALLGLLVGFTFSGAAERFDTRRQRIGDEVHAINVGWEAIDVLPPESQPAVRDGFRRYIDAMYASDLKGGEPPDKFVEDPPVAAARGKLWHEAVAVCTIPSGERARLILLPALSTMFVASENETLARRIHPPKIVFAMLGLTALAAALLGGYALASSLTRNWLYMVGVALAVSVSAYVILDLEYPRIGWVRVDPLDEVLRDIHANLK